MKRLSHQIYLTIIVCLIAVVAIAAVTLQRSGRQENVRHAFAVAGELASAALPDAGAPNAQQQRAVARLATRLRLELGLYSPGGERIAAVSRHPLPGPPRHRDESGFIYGRGGPAWAIALPDGRWLVARAPRRGHRRPIIGFILLLGGIALVVAIASWPVVRGLTRRLEHLQEGVERLGAGDLSARVDVSGRDEVAQLAASFNKSAARIDALLRSHKLLLANASHELRTPLARIRLATELLKDDADPKRKEALERDIAELDKMIEEILLLSRLDALDELEVREDVDLLALAAEEGARFSDCDVSGSPVTVNGDSHLLRRLLRNLIENADRHGAPPIHLTINEGNDESAVIVVTDNGPGVSSAVAEHIFEPFMRGASRGTRSGTGLGLALVRQIAERHGGTVELLPGSDRKRLNRFRVTLQSRAA